MKVVFWLSWQELLNRKMSLTIGVIMVSIAVSLCASIELISRARETTVAIEIDNIGPALCLIPAGKTARDLARFDLGPNYFSKSDVKKIQRRFSRQVRTLDQRLRIPGFKDNMLIPIIGIDPINTSSHFGLLKDLTVDSAALGMELAKKLAKRPGDKITLQGASFTVMAILPQTGNSDDIALFLPLSKVFTLFGFSDYAVNEIGVYPLPGANQAEIISEIKSDFPHINVINMYRGEVAELEMNKSLNRNRQVLYAIIGIVVALCISIWSYLNSNERKLEIATIIAIGSSKMTVMAMLIYRAIVVGALGAIVGYAVSVMIVLLIDFESGRHAIGSFLFPLTLFGGAIFLCIVGSFPVSFVTSFREHVTLLQE